MTRSLLQVDNNEWLICVLSSLPSNLISRKAWEGSSNCNYHIWLCRPIFKLLKLLFVKCITHYFNLVFPIEPSAVNLVDMTPRHSWLLMKSVVILSHHLVDKSLVEEGGDSVMSSCRVKPLSISCFHLFANRGQIVKPRSSRYSCSIVDDHTLCIFDLLSHQAYLCIQEVLVVLILWFIETRMMKAVVWPLFLVAF